MFNAINMLKGFNGRFNKSKVLHEESTTVSSASPESQLSEPAEQESAIPQSTDAGINEIGTMQDCDNPTEQQTRSQMDRPVSIDRVITFDDESPVIVLKIINVFSGEAQCAKIRYEDFTKKALEKCVKRHGGSSDNWDNLFDLLTHEIEMCRKYKQIITMHGHIMVGWNKRGNNIVFDGQNRISLDGQSSEYMGTKDIKPKGELSKIVEMIKKRILSTSEWSPLQAIIAFSVGSIILPFAKYVWGKNMNNLIIHLLGNSTSGKTTSLRLHAGLASNPYNEKTGFFLNFQSSLTAIIRRIGDNHGFPVSIDELSSASKKEFTDFVYTIGNENEKDRLMAGGTKLCDSASFNTIIVSSGEASILDKCLANVGIRARCVEIAHEKWTESKEQADAICDCLSENYGLVAPLVAEELLNNSEQWKNRWTQISNTLSDKMAEDKILISIAPRIGEFVTLFTLAAEITNKVLNISLDVDAIFNFCFGYIITAIADEVNIGERAYEYLLRYASEHLEEFPDKEFGSDLGSFWSKESIKGFYRDARKPRTINGREYRQQLVFFVDEYERILKEKGLSPHLVNQDLREKHFLQTKDNKRYTYPLTYNNTNQQFYVLYCRREDDYMWEAMANGTYNTNGEEDYEM